MSVASTVHGLLESGDEISRGRLFLILDSVSAIYEQTPRGDRVPSLEVKFESCVSQKDDRPSSLSFPLDGIARIPSTLSAASVIALLPAHDPSCSHSPISLSTRLRINIHARFS